MYFTALSCLHTEINFRQPPERDQNVPHLYPYHLPVPNSSTFPENVEIPWKQANSGARLKNSAKKTVAPNDDDNDDGTLMSSLWTI